MRLQLKAALSLLLLADAAWAQEASLSTKVQIYTDNDRTVVVSPHLDAQGTLPSGTSLNAAYTEDVVSSASVDVRTTASPRIYDRRQEIDLGAGQDVAGAKLGVSGMYSQERDYVSLGAALTGSSELNQRNTALSLRVGYMSNVVGRAGDPAYRAPRTDWNLDGALTQAFSPTTIGQLNATLGRSDGMLASPYRRVSVLDGRYVLPENHPAERTLIAAAVGLKQFFLDRWVAHLEYRLYHDTYALLTHTVDARVSLTVDVVTLRLRYRYYRQNAAYFYQPRYDQVLLYLSSDRELSAFASQLAGLKLEWEPRRLTLAAAQLRFDAKVEVMYFRYPDFPSLPERWALISQVGLAVVF